MNKYKNGYLYKNGDKIEGIYHGVPYNGTVRIARRHTVRHDLTELTVDLSHSVTVYGTDRTTIIVSILDDGKEF